MLANLQFILAAVMLVLHRAPPHASLHRGQIVNFDAVLQLCMLRVVRTQVKEEDTVTVGQVVAKITPGCASQGQEAADTDASSDQAEALEKESPISAGDHFDYDTAMLASQARSNR